MNNAMYHRWCLPSFDVSVSYTSPIPKPDPNPNPDPFPNPEPFPNPTPDPPGPPTPPPTRPPIPKIQSFSFPQQNSYFHETWSG